MQILASEVSADYYTHPPGVVILIMLAITYSQWPYIFIHRVDSTTIQDIACTGTPGMATSAVGVMKMGNIVPRVGIEPTPLAFPDRCATVTPCRLPDITIIPLPSCLQILASEVSADYYIVLNLNSLHVCLDIYILW